MTINCLQQALQQKAVNIASTYTDDTASWVKAATELRQPYWDWARPQGPVPPEEVISMQQVTIVKPDGIRGLVDNPLVYFRFPSEESRATFSSTYRSLEMTVRNPMVDGDTVVSDVESLKESVFFFLLRLSIMIKFFG
jgi:tyrosinase